LTEKQQKEKLCNYVLGNDQEDYMSLTEQMVHGLNQFAGLYEDIEFGVNDDKNVSPCNQDGLCTQDGNNTPNSNPRAADKILKECFFPQYQDRGKLTIFANKPGGITVPVLCAKNLNNPVDVSGNTILRGAKEVLQNCTEQ
jgi:hypothetical protein